MTAVPLLIIPQLLISVMATGFADESYTRTMPLEAKLRKRLQRVSSELTAS